MAALPKPPSGPLGKEPAGTIGSSISFVLMGLWLVLKNAGVEVTEDLSSGVELIIWGLLSVPALSGWLTRFFVFSPHTTQRKINTAAASGEAGKVVTPPPEVVAPPYDIAANGVTHGQNGYLRPDDPRFDPNDPSEVPPSKWAVPPRRLDDE